MNLTYAKFVPESFSSQLFVCIKAKFYNHIFNCVFKNNMESTVHDYSKKTMIHFEFERTIETGLSGSVTVTQSERKTKTVEPVLRLSRVVTFELA